MTVYSIQSYIGVVLICLGFGISMTGCQPDHSSSHTHPHSHAEPGLSPTAYPDRIIVSWKQSPASSFSVTWRTDSTIGRGKALVAPASPAPKFHRYADTLFSTISPVKDPGKDVSQATSHYHSVTFSGLESDSLYAYKVGGGGHWSEWFHMRTAKEQDDAFSFLYVGDAQNGVFSHWSRAIRAAYSKAPDSRFIIHAGDLIDHKNHVGEWGQWNRAGGWIHGSIPAIAVPGNHEYLDYRVDDPEPVLSIYWKPQFTFPENGPEGLEETAYYIDYQGVRLIALNSNEQIEKQTEWLEKVLAKTEKRWVVVTHHHPIYSSGKGRNNPEIRSQWQPLYEKYHVDLVLQGHDHTYARGQSVNTPNGVNTVDPESGTVYVNSVSGAKMYRLKDGFWNNFGADMQRSAENTQLYQVIHVSRDTLNFRSYTVTDQLYDAFDLVRQPDQDKTRMIDRTPETQPRRYNNTIPY